MIYTADFEEFYRLNWAEVKELIRYNWPRLTQDYIEEGEFRFIIDIPKIIKKYKVKGKANFRTYIEKCLKFRFSNFFAFNQRKKRYMPGMEMLEYQDYAEYASVTDPRLDELLDAQEAFSKVPGKMREVAKLYAQGYDFKEIRGITGIQSHHTTKKYYDYVLDKLKQN